MLTWRQRFVLWCPANLRPVGRSGCQDVRVRGRIRVRVGLLGGDGTVKMFP